MPSAAGESAKTPIWWFPGLAACTGGLVWVVDLYFDFDQVVLILGALVVIVLLGIGTVSSTTE